MAFISSCPKCQKQVLVPDGTSPDAVVRCPICAVEYSLGEILAMVPPALIVVHAGSAVAPAQGVAPLVEASVAAAGATAAEAGEGSIFAAHRVEPTLHDAEPLLFAAEEVQLATPDYGHAEPFGSADAEHLAEAALFEPSPEAAQGTDQPIEAEPGHPLAGTLAAPLSEDGHDLAAEPADGSALGRRLGWIQRRSRARGRGAVGLAEPDQDEGLEHVDFAAITGKAAPGSGLSQAPAMWLSRRNRSRRRRQAGS